MDLLYAALYIAVVACVGLKYEHLFTVPKRRPNCEETMKAYRARFGIYED